MEEVGIVLIALSSMCLTSERPYQKVHTVDCRCSKEDGSMQEGAIAIYMYNHVNVHSSEIPNIGRKPPKHGYVEWTIANLHYNPI